MGDDPECTDCDGTGITIQTERRCACQPATPPMNDLCERLRAVESSGGAFRDITANWHRNPDGPEAADEITRLRARVAELEGEPEPEPEP